MFTFFTDRDGSTSSRRSRESGFDPLALALDALHAHEEAHHLVGESGIARILQRTAR